jgi:hypothetical protein
MSGTSHIKTVTVVSLGAPYLTIVRARAIAEALLGANVDKCITAAVPSNSNLTSITPIYSNINYSTSTYGVRDNIFTVEPDLKPQYKPSRLLKALIQKL